MSKEYIVIKARIERAMAEVRDVAHSVKVLDPRFFQDMDTIEGVLKRAAHAALLEEGNLVLYSRDSE